jgi:hypothetical protein
MYRLEKIVDVVDRVTLNRLLIDKMKMMIIQNRRGGCRGRGKTAINSAYFFSNKYLGC